MSRIPIQEFVNEHGQTKASKILGLSQGSLNKALRVGRRISVIKHDDGTFTAEELRPFPSQAKREAASAA